MPWSRSKHNTAVKRDEGTLWVSGQRLYYRRMVPRDIPQAEKRPSLVLLHEGLGCTAMWHDFPDALVDETGLSVISYDRRGYGRSQTRSLPWSRDYLHVEARDILPRCSTTLVSNTPFW